MTPAQRRAARRAALGVLYAADTAQAGPGSLDADPDTFGPIDDFGASLVAGVDAHGAEIDAWLGETAENWALGRMPPVDRAILRMATFELRWRDDIPAGATINEAVELARCYSTTDSSRFVNGVLGKLARRFGRAGSDADDAAAAGRADAHADPAEAAEAAEAGGDRPSIVIRPIEVAGA